jgi:hypothetical protein
MNTYARRTPLRRKNVSVVRVPFMMSIMLRLWWNCGEDRNLRVKLTTRNLTTVVDFVEWRLMFCARSRRKRLLSAPDRLMGHPVSDQIRAAKGGYSWG